MFFYEEPVIEVIPRDPYDYGIESIEINKSTVNASANETYTIRVSYRDGFDITGANIVMYSPSEVENRMGSRISVSSLTPVDGRGYFDFIVETKDINESGDWMVGEIKFTTSSNYNSYIYEKGINNDKFYMGYKDDFDDSGITPPKIYLFSSNADTEFAKITGYNLSKSEVVSDEDFEVTINAEDSGGSGINKVEFDLYMHVDGGMITTHTIHLGESNGTYSGTSFFSMGSDLGIYNVKEIRDIDNAGNKTTYVDEMLGGDKLKVYYSENYEERTVSNIGTGYITFK